MSIFEYDQEMHMNLIREEGREEGRQEGRHEGQEGLSRLIQLDKIDEVSKVCADPNYCG